MKSKPQSLGSGSAQVNAGPAWVEVLRDLPQAESAVAILRTVVTRMVADEGAAAAVILVPTETDGWMPLVVAGMDADAERSTKMAFARSLSTWVSRTRLPVGIEDPGVDPRFTPTTALPPGWGFPLVAGNQIYGALVVFEHDISTWSQPHREMGWEPWGTVAALCLERSRLRESMTAVSADYHASETRRLQCERGAAVGSVVQDMAEEMRATLGGLGGRLLKLGRTFDTADERRPVMDLLIQDVERIAGLLQSQIDLTAADHERRPEDLNRLVAETLALVKEELDTRGVIAFRRLSSSMPILLLDVGLMRQVLLNLIREATACSPRGGRLRVETKRRGSQVEVAVSADREATSDVMDSLFANFKPESGRPLEHSNRMVRQVLAELRGSVEVTSDPEWGLITTLTLPIPGNEDRRRSSDRRSGGDRRSA